MIVKVHHFYKSSPNIVDLTIGQRYGEPGTATNLFVIFLFKQGYIHTKPEDLVIKVAGDLRLLSLHKSSRGLVESFMKHLAQHSAYLEKLYENKKR